MELQHNETSNEDSESGSHYIHFTIESLTRISNKDPALAVASCADLNRKTIEKMKIKSCSLQDLQIFCSISQVPVIYVEQHMIQCQRSGVIEDVASLGLDGPLKKNQKLLLCQMQQ